jgi:hypothetical protein
MDYYWKIMRWIRFVAFAICLSGTGVLVIVAPIAPNFHWYYLFIGFVPLFAYGVSEWFFKPFLMRILSRPFSKQAQEHFNVIKFSFSIAYIVYTCSVLMFLLLSTWPYLMVLRAFGGIEIRFLTITV